jgi:hypothetical protein
MMDKGDRKTLLESTRTSITRINKYFSTITINVNGLNSPIKRHRQ